MEIEKPSTCASASRVFVSIVVAVICFSYGNGYAQQQNVSIGVEFELAPMGVLAFEIDGTDAALGRTTNETCALGTVDSLGTPISGAPVGNPNVNGVAGIPVDSAGAPLADFYDAGCIGLFIPFLPPPGATPITSIPMPPYSYVSSQIRLGHLHAAPSLSFQPPR